MTVNPVEELQRQGLVGDGVSSKDADWISSVVSDEQLSAFVETAERINALAEPAVQQKPVEDGSLALAMVEVLGWDRPAATAVDAEVEAMEKGACLCACTGGGGGGGA
jgi:hypothetical protein